MKTNQVAAPITVRAGGMTATYKSGGVWLLRSGGAGGRNVSHEALRALLPDNTAPRRGRKGR